MNIATLIGRLTRDPERVDRGGTVICNFTIAVDRPKDGADFIRITVFGKQAENCSQYLTKGRQVAVQGHIQTGSYPNKDGQTVYTTDVIGDRIDFLGSANTEKRDNNSYHNYGGYSEPRGYQMYKEDDLF